MVTLEKYVYPTTMYTIVYCFRCIQMHGVHLIGNAVQMFQIKLNAVSSVTAFINANNYSCMSLTKNF